MGNQSDLEDILNSGDILLIKVGGNEDNKKILTEEEIIALEEAGKDWIQFNPLDTLPNHVKGLLFYDNKHDALSYYNNISGVSINIGKEFVDDLYNDTGVTIPNGTPVRYLGGVDPTTNKPLAEPAIADNFINSRVFGMTTNTVANNTVGLATTNGVVHNVDTSAFSLGALLYLSDTVPGGLTTTPPDIITLVGSVRKVGTTDGAIYVNPDVNVTLPNTYGNLDGKTNTFTPSATYQDMNNYDNADAVGDLATTSTGYIRASKTTKYELTVTLSATFADSGAATETVELQLWDATNNLQVGLSTMTIPRNSVSASRSFSRLFSAISNHDYVLRLRSTTGFTETLTFVDLNFYAISL